MTHGEADGQAVGPVPFRVRIGVTGHRQLPEGVDWRERIADALKLIETRLAPTGDAPLTWLVISSLAEGADRLVAEAILARPGSLLEVPLPLSRDDYETDFETGTSKADFGRLYDQASLVMCAPPFKERSSAYEWAGVAMIGRSDIVIALWDGEPAQGVGGTADIVTLARRYGRPVVHVPVAGDQDIEILHPFAEQEPGGAQPEQASPLDPFGELRRALHGMEAYNRVNVSPGMLTAASEQARADLMESITEPAARTIWEPVASWLIPYYAKADLLAQAGRARVKSLLAITFTCPVLAIATVAIQSQFFARLHELIWAEVVFLLAVPVVMLLDRTPRLLAGRAADALRPGRLPVSAQQQWVICRHLAERLRAAFFLAAVQPPRGRGPGAAGLDDSADEDTDLQPLEVAAAPIQTFRETAEGWPSRLYGEAWLRRPPALVTDSDLAAVRAVLAEQWIRGQEAYHFKAAHRNHRNERNATNAIYAIFILTAAVAALHAAGAGAGNSAAEKTLTFVAIVFPALAAAATTLIHHFEFRRHRDTSESMRRRLGYAADLIGRAPTLPELRREAEATERLMMTENREWFSLMRLHELELHA